jgi:hypothetical protein
MHGKNAPRAVDRRSAQGQIIGLAPNSFSTAKFDPVKPSRGARVASRQADSRAEIADAKRSADAGPLT